MLKQGIHWPLSPGVTHDVSHTAFIHNAENLLNAALQGDVVIIRQNPAILDLIASEVKPALARQDHTFFRENVPALYDQQRLQKALFAELPAREDYFIDAFLRFRRTTGKGGFVGPHCDRFEGLPKHCLNFWTTYLDLGTDEAINLYPAHWHPKFNLSGSAKPGVYRDRQARLMPTQALQKARLTFALKAGDTVLFNSGSVIHSSPFFVKTHRITSDLRLVPMQTADDLRCLTYDNYYRLTDLHTFDGSVPVQANLKRLWQGYTPVLNLYGLYHCNTVEERRTVLSAALSAELSPAVIIRLWQDNALGDIRLLAKKILDLHPLAVAPRVQLLPLIEDRDLVHRIGNELIQLAVENPVKVLQQLTQTLSAVALAKKIAKTAPARSQKMLGFMLTVLYGLIARLPEKLNQRLRLSIVLEKIAWKIYAINPQWSINAMQLSPKKLRCAMLATKLPTAPLRRLFRTLTNAPELKTRAQNILFALEYIRQNAARGRSQLRQIAEFGTASGEGLRQLYILTRNFTHLYGMDMPTVYGFDTFTGLPHSEHRSDIGNWEAGDYPGDETLLQAFILQAGWSDTCRLVKGLFADTLPAHPEISPDFILIDCDYYTSTYDVFTALKDRLDSGTVIYFDDLGSNHFNRNMGEEKLIHEVQSGQFGEAYHLHPIYGQCYVWSNADKPVRKSRKTVLNIALKNSTTLDNFY